MLNGFVPPHTIPVGGTIGIFSPSEPITPSRDVRFRAGLDVLAKNGYVPRLGKNCLRVTGYTAGSAQERVADIHELASDETVAALMASWGGKSCNQLLEQLDYSSLASARKPIMAFSDGCVLLNIVAATTGLITFYGPNVVGKLYETQHSDLLLLNPGGVTPNLLGRSAATVSDVLRGGVAEGRLFGGNLSTFTLGAVLHPAASALFKNGIFFWEEASLPPQLIDQYLTGLKNAGLFQQIAGMIIGDFIHEDDVEWKRANPFDAVMSIVGEYEFPILYSPTFGHKPLENPILPVGALCRLDTDSALLVPLEPIAG